MRLPSLAVLVVMVCATAGCAEGPPTPPPVHAEVGRYQALRQVLEAELDAALAASGASPGSSEAPTAARLWTADSRLGPWLLASGFSESRSKIAALRERGIRQVDVAVAYPALSGEEARAEEYRRFYAELADEVRRQGLALRVLTGPQYRDAYRLRGHPVAMQCGDNPAETFARHASTVAAVMGPDYLSLDLSPATLAVAPGCELYASASAAAELAMEAVRALDLPGHVRVGVSARVTEEPAFFDALLESDSEFFIDVSVFRVTAGGKDHLDALRTLVEAARAAGKDVAVGGYWLQKTDAVDDVGYLGLAYSTRDAATDTFDLWEPVDGRMHRLMRALSSQYGLLYASAYRSDLLFAYLPTREALASDIEPLNLLRQERSKSRMARIEYLKQLAEERRAAGLPQGGSTSESSGRQP